jgi:hypothetical protein
MEMTPAVDLMLRVKYTALQEAPRPSGVTGPIEASITLCFGCGAPVWQGTNPLKEEGARDRVVIDTMAQQKGLLCKNCKAFQYRYPEVFGWVNDTHDWRNNRHDILGLFAKQGEPRPPEPAPEKPKDKTNGKPTGRGKKKTAGKGKKK